jgi:hypothetical protein
MSKKGPCAGPEARKRMVALALALAMTSTLLHTDGDDDLLALTAGRHLSRDALLRSPSFCAGFLLRRRLQWSLRWSWMLLVQWLGLLGIGGAGGVELAGAPPSGKWLACDVGA